ncbi:tail completion protein gp17 [Haematobacter massiliensis]|uniref:tail completion protein gp17 n=1 Tax=Haematobacter massiliensis TaxID=195105 RepID=UPI0023F46FFA|nr:DUF3168 domain-containing protein [Haematobacter massiliensis]
MEEDFRGLLVAASPGGLTAERINWMVHPQGVDFPGLVLTLVDDLSIMTQEGPSDLSAARVQVDCYALTYAEAVTIGRAVRARLDGHSDARFQGVFLSARRAGRDDAHSARPYRVSLDFETAWNNF